MSSRAPFAIATAANEKYRSILEGLIRSIRSHPQSAGVPIVVLDLGLSDDTKAWLVSQQARSVAPDWDFPFDRPMPEYFKAMASRPHLPKYIPEADSIIWLDADTWVQDWSAIELLLQGAAATGFSITPELDRSYTPMYDGGPYINHQFGWLRDCFDEETARRLCYYPLINCGVFAAHRDAPHWQAWSSTLAESFRRVVLFISEQTALNVVLRSSGLPVSFLPSTCNWICYRAQPFCSEDGRLLLDPQVPHAPIGIVHLAGYAYDKKDLPLSLRTPSGGAVSRPLTYQAL